MSLFRCARSAALAGGLGDSCRLAVSDGSGCDAALEFRQADAQGLSHYLCSFQMAFGNTTGEKSGEAVVRPALNECGFRIHVIK